MLTAQTALAAFLASTFRLGHDSLSVGASGLRSRNHQLHAKQVHIWDLFTSLLLHVQIFPSYGSCLILFFPWEESQEFLPI